MVVSDDDTLAGIGELVLDSDHLLIILCSFDPNDIFQLLVRIDNLSIHGLNFKLAVVVFANIFLPLVSRLGTQGVHRHFVDAVGFVFLGLGRVRREAECDLGARTQGEFCGPGEEAVEVFLLASLLIGYPVAIVISLTVEAVGVEGAGGCGGEDD